MLGARFGAVPSDAKEGLGVCELGVAWSSKGFCIGEYMQRVSRW
jgi:hypothetical protein